MIKTKYKFSHINLITICLILTYALFLIYKIQQVPTVFVDEDSYMSELISLLNTGKDLNSLSFPAYFRGLYGNGQSVAYAAIAFPFLKVVGFSIFKFRLPMVMLTLLNLFLLHNYLKKKDAFLSFFVIVVFISSPWLFMSSRWVLDCNVAPELFLISVLLLLYSLSTNKLVLKYIYLFISAFSIALAVWGYIAGWIFLPLFLLFMFFYLWKQKCAIKLMAFYFLLVLFFSIPMIVFAVRFLVLKSDTIGTLGFIHFPVMNMNRGDSFISFNSINELPTAIYQNVINGFNMYASGSDGLDWNSASPYGLMYPPFIFLSILGLFASTKKFDNGIQQLKTVTVLALVAYLPSILVVKPNFNDWNFLNVLLLIFGGLGLYTIFKIWNKKIAVGVSCALLVIFVVFTTNKYFNKDSFYVNGGGLNNTKTYVVKTPSEVLTLQKENTKKSNMHY